MGDQDVLDQQLGCIWIMQDTILSVSLSGNINYIDAEKGEVKKVVEGHNKPITAMTKMNGKVVFTAASDGRIIKWDTEKGEGVQVKAQNGPDNQVNALVWSEERQELLAASIDDCLRTVGEDNKFTQFNVKFNGQPRDLAVSGKKMFVATVSSVMALVNGEVVAEKRMPDSSELSCVAATNNGHHVAVGDSGHELRILDADSLDEVKMIKLTGQLTSLAFSDDGKLLASADSNRKVTLFSVENNYDKAHGKEWGFHTAKVTCVAFSPDSKFVASGGLDCSVIIWSVDHPSKHHIHLSAHVQSQITAIEWFGQQDRHHLGPGRKCQNLERHLDAAIIIPPLI